MDPSCLFKIFMIFRLILLKDVLFAAVRVHIYSPCVAFCDITVLHKLLEFCGVRLSVEESCG